MKNKHPRAVVIGGAGFIGSYVVRELLSKKYTVIVIDNLSTGSRSRLPKGVKIIKKDIRIYEDLITSINKDDIIFHLAALVSVPLSFEKPLESHEINVRGMYNVLEAARVKKARGVIFSSSAAVYGNFEGLITEETPTSPVSPYGLHKLMGEGFARLYSECFSLPTVALRYFNVYGKGHHEEGSYAPVIAKFLKLKKAGKPLTITGNGLQTRDFVHVKDVAAANVDAIRLLSKPHHHCFNICTGKEYTVKKIAELIGGEIQYIPARKEVKNSKGSNKLAKKILQWKPEISLQEGLKIL